MGPCLQDGLWWHYARYSNGFLRIPNWGPIRGLRAFKNPYGEFEVPFELICGLVSLLGIIGAC